MISSYVLKNKIKLLIKSLAYILFNNSNYNMFTTSNFTNNHINNYTNFINSTINNRIDAGIMTKADFKIIRKILIRIQTDTNFLNAIKEFNVSFANLDINWTIGATSVLNYNMDSSIKLTSILVSLLVCIQILILLIYT